MVKFDITSKVGVEEQCTKLADNDDHDATMAVFVDTDLGTHLVVPVSSLITVLCLKKEISLHHYKFFPEFACVTIKSVLVKFHENYYHLPDSMLLKSIFHGTGETWCVFADVWTPVSPNHLNIQMNQDDHLNKHSEGHHHTSVAQSSPKHLEGGETAHVELLEHGGNNTNVAESLKKARGIDNTGLPIRALVKETKKRKKSDAVGVASSHPLSAPKGPDLPDLLSQPDQDSTFLKSGKTSKKRKTNVSEQDSQINDEKVSPLHLNNAAELSSQREPLNLFDKDKEIEKDAAPLKSRYTAKKSKNEKAKISGIKKHDLSCERQNEDQSAEPEDNCRPEKKMDSMSRMFHEIRNRKDVPEDLLGSHVKEPLDEANRGMGPPTTVIQSDRSTKRSHKKEAESSVAEIQELFIEGQNEELNAEYVYRPEESVETKSCKSKKLSKFRKDVSHKDPPNSSLKEQSDEETSELAAPRTVIQHKPKKKNQKKQFIPGKDLCSVNQLVDEASLEIVAPKRVKEAGCFLTNPDKNDGVNQIIVMHDEGNQDELSEKTGNPPQPREVSSDFADFKHLEKPRPSKHKAKKLDQASSVDIIFNGHKLVGSKKDRDDTDTSLLQKVVTEHEHSKSRPPLMDPFVTQIDPINSRKAGVSRESVNQASKVSGANFSLETNSSKRVEQADDLLTDSRSSDGQNQKEMAQGEDDRAHFSQAPNVEISPVSLAKPRARKEKEKNVDSPSSVDMSSNGHHSAGLEKSRGNAKTSMPQKSITGHKHDKSISPSGSKRSTIPKEVMDTPVPLADPTKNPQKNAISSRSIDDGSKSSGATRFSSGSPVRKIRQKEKTTKPSKMEAMTITPRRSSRSIVKETMKTPEQKKGLLAYSEAIFEDGSSSSSDDNDRNDASSLSTAPDNLSSSDYSEGESKGVGESKHDSRKGNGRRESNSSGTKLESILRSSSIYKKAKLVASQSQEESQALEFVPDSQAS